MKILAQNDKAQLVQIDPKRQSCWLIMADGSRKIYMSVAQAQRAFAKL